MILTKHFTLEEFCYSINAIRLRIANVLPDTLRPAALALHEKIVEPLRVAVGVWITEDSGYRCLELNRAIGSNDDSQHVKAEAVDIRVKGMTPQQVCDKIVALGLPFDQLIEEFGEWTHVSYGPRNRRQKLKARYNAQGKKVYEVMV